MTAKDAILQTFGLGESMFDKYLGDLSDAELLIRPVAGQNHIAWQLGHLIASEHGMLEAIRPGSSPPLPEGFADAHGRDEASTASDDHARFRTKDEYTRLFKAQREASRKVLAELSDADLDAPAPERLRTFFPTVGAVFVLIGSHVIMHSGQFVGVRRLKGKPIAI